MRSTGSIALTFTLVVSVCAILIFSVAIGYLYHRSRIVLEQEVALNAANRAQALINRLETSLQSIGKVTEEASLALASGNYDQHNLPVFMRQTLRANRGFHGFGAFLEPDSSLNSAQPFGSYFFRKELRLISAPETDFQYLQRDWYQIARELKKTVWSEPYKGKDSGMTLMTSCSSPILTGKRPERRVQGVVVADVSLLWLTRLVSTMQVLESGYSFLLSQNGTYLVHPDQELVLNETIFSQAELLARPELRELGRAMLRGESDFIVYTDYRNRPARLYYAPVPATGWTLAVVFPEDELYANVHFLTLTVIAIALAGIVLLTVAVYAISHRVTRPLGALASASAKIAAGNFNVALPPIRSRDEVGGLTLAFSAMVRDLKTYIHDLTETTAAKERIQSELKVATHIQSSLLPRLFPPFPHRLELDIYASMDPAKEVGGDFYDFFLVDERHLCFLIADVADKGVPAALYMMVAKTLLKAEGQRLGEPERILANVNAILAADNDTCMFITVFCAILDTQTGEVRFANAGHNPPALIRDGQVSYLSMAPGIVLGVMPEAVYNVEQTFLLPGDVFFLYTDGVTEAANSEGELYGEERLQRILRENTALDLAGMNLAVREDIARHARTAPQSDDVTMLAIRYWGQPSAPEREKG